MGAGEIVILEERPGRCTATWHNVLLMFGGARSSTEEFDRIAAAFERLSSEHPEGVAGFRWVPPRAPGPDDDTRDRVAELFDALGERLQAFVVVVEGEGFWAGGARSVLTDISQRSGFSTPLVVLQELDAGSRWLAERFPGVELGPLRHAVARVRTRVVRSGSPR